MASLPPTGMGPRTSRQFNRVANQMLRYIYGSQEYDEFNPVGNQWNKHEVHMAVQNNPPKGRATRLPKAQPAPMPVLPPPDREQRVARKTVR